MRDEFVRFVADLAVDDEFGARMTLCKSIADAEVVFLAYARARDLTDEEARVASLLYLTSKQHTTSHILRMLESS